jgi:hypothetical protein
MRLLGGLVLIGLPGFLLGTAVGVAVRRWVLLLVFAVLAVAALALGIDHAPDGPDDDDPDELIELAMVTNFVGWLAGLTVGFVLRRPLHRDTA